MGMSTRLGQIWSLVPAEYAVPILLLGGAMLVCGHCFWGTTMVQYFSHFFSFLKSSIGKWVWFRWGSMLACTLGSGALMIRKELSRTRYVRDYSHPRGHPLYPTRTAGVSRDLQAPDPEQRHVWQLQTANGGRPGNADTNARQREREGG